MEPASVSNSERMVRLANMLYSKKKVVMITGAGLSVASGIPTFRSKDGVWDKNLMIWGTRDMFRHWDASSTLKESAIEWYELYPGFLRA